MRARSASARGPKEGDFHPMRTHAKRGAYRSYVLAAALGLLVSGCPRKEEPAERAGTTGASPRASGAPGLVPRPSAEPAPKGPAALNMPARNTWLTDSVMPIS